MVDGLFAATPPLESLRLILGWAATVDGGLLSAVGETGSGKSILVADVSRAFFEAPPKETSVWNCLRKHCKETKRHRAPLESCSRVSTGPGMHPQTGKKKLPGACANGVSKLVGLTHACTSMSRERFDA